MNKTILTAAIAIAKKTDTDLFKSSNSRMGAVLFKASRILCLDHNKNKTHPMLQGLYKYPVLHAESSVLIRYGLDNCKNLNLLIVRINSKDQLTMAKPCSSCQSFIKLAKLKRVYYSDWQGEIKEL